MSNHCLNNAMKFLLAVQMPTQELSYAIQLVAIHTNIVPELANLSLKLLAHLLDHLGGEPPGKVPEGHDFLLHHIGDLGSVVSQMGQRASYEWGGVPAEAQREFNPGSD